MKKSLIKARSLESKRCSKQDDGVKQSLVKTAWLAVGMVTFAWISLFVIGEPHIINCFIQANKK